MSVNSDGEGSLIMQDMRPNIFPALRYRDAEAALGWLEGAGSRMTPR